MKAMELNFINGKATIKEGGKIIAKIYYLPVFLNLLNVNWNKKYPYRIEINGLSAQCKDMAEVTELFYSEIS